MPFFLQDNPSSIPAGILEAGTPAALVLMMCEAGAITLEDVWSPSTSAPVQPLLLKWIGTVTPRLNSSKSAPDAQEWQKALAGQAAEGLAPSERVVAWAMQDARAWTTTPPAYSHFSNGEALETMFEMVVANGWAWAGKAMLSQPQHPTVEEPILHRLATECLIMKHAPMLEVLLQHGLDPNIRFEPGQRSALHQALDAETVSALLRHGADPMAVDDDGLTCDEVWLRHNNLDAEKVKAMVAARQGALENLSAPIREAAARRQNEFLFKNDALDAFDAWLRKQPHDLTVGEGRGLPSDALWSLTHTPAELGKRAGLLLRHESPQSLLREGAHGGTERESLWWLCVLADQKGLQPALRKGFASALQPGAWLTHLDTLEAVLRHPEPVSRYGQVAERHGPLGEACLSLLTIGLHQVNPTLFTRCEVDKPSDSSLRTHLVDMPAAMWTQVDDLERTPLTRLVQAAADCWKATAGWNNIPAGASSALRLLAEHIRHTPLLPNGQPDHALLAAVTQFMATRHPAPPNPGSLPNFRISDDAQAVAAAWDNGTKAQRNGSMNYMNDAVFVPLLNIAGALVASGAKVPAPWVETMTQNPQLQHITPLFRAACLDATLDEGGPAARRLRM